MSSKFKIGLVGGGNIGGTLAFAIAHQGIADVVLLDNTSATAEGKALDIVQSIKLSNVNVNVIGTSDYSYMEDADVVIVTAGSPRKPGMTRDDLIETNARVMEDVGTQLKKYTPNAFVIVVTNPLDVMVYMMQRITGFDHRKVVGMAGVLDSARFAYFLSKELNVALEDVNTFVLGGHGDTMVPLVRYSTVAGISIPDLIKMGLIEEEKVQEIVDRTRNGGGEIVKLLQKGSAYYAPAMSALEMASSYLFDKRKILTCAAYLTGQYNVNNLYVGVPVIIGSNGVEKILEIPMTPEEKTLFQNSVKSVSKMIDVVKY